MSMRVGCSCSCYPNTLFIYLSRKNFLEVAHAFYCTIISFDLSSVTINSFCYLE